MLTQRQPEPIKGPFALIPLKPAGYAIVDVADFADINRYHWKLRKSRHLYYAVRTFRWNGRQHIVRMHREISQPKKGEHVHHKNHNPLDNRRCNLENLTPEAHDRQRRKGRD